MPRFPFLAFAAAGCLACTAIAGEVYQWKDANGVTHYSQTPPPKGSYQQRQFSGNGGSAPARATAEVEATGTDPACATARANVATLTSGRPVHQADADGAPGRALNDAERASQLELAQAAVRAYCSPATD